MGLYPKAQAPYSLVVLDLRCEKVALGHLLSNLLALRNPIVDYGSLNTILETLCKEPVALLGLATLPFLSWRWRSRRTLLLLFTLVSLGVATMTYLQAGAAENYFFEFLFGLAPFAVLGVLKIQRSRVRVADLVLATLLVILAVMPVARSVIKTARSMPAIVAGQNRQMLKLQDAFHDHKVLALVPEVAYFAPDIILSDPFFSRYAELLGKFDLRPLAGGIRKQSFDLIVVAKEPTAYRGIVSISPTLRPAIAETYQPFCMVKDWVTLLPRSAPVPEALSGKLAAAGCDVDVCAMGHSCSAW